MLHPSVMVKKIMVEKIMAAYSWTFWSQRGLINFTRNARKFDYILLLTYFYRNSKQL